MCHAQLILLTTSQKKLHPQHLKLLTMSVFGNSYKYYRDVSGS